MMRSVMTMAWAALAVLALGHAPAWAQARAMTAQERANLALVDAWWREVLQAGHVELAAKYMAEDYIQHNPTISTGRTSFVEVFGRRGAPRAIQPVLMPAPVLHYAKGDYVVFVWEREGKDQTGASYKYNTFDLVRVQNGKAQEHWDSAFRTKPMPGQPSPAPVVAGVGPTPVKPRNTAEEQRNEDIANVEMHDILQYGHVELASKVMAAGYIQHNPNVPGGRDGFVEFFSRIRKPEPIKAEWKDTPELILTSGNLVLYMMERYSADPVDSSKVYTWNWFDLFRVDDGLVQEHWDTATKTPPPASVPRPAK